MAKEKTILINLRVPESLLKVWYNSGYIIRRKHGERKNDFN